MASRQKLYTHGGILSVTSRILVVDLLASEFLGYFLGVSNMSRNTRPRDNFRFGYSSC